MSLATGERFGSYEVVELIGIGGMGEVYRARDPRLDRDVALKILPHASRLDPEALQRFEREARVLAALNHPNVATLHGIAASGDTQALMTGYDHGTLMAVPVETGGATLTFGAAEPLFPVDMAIVPHSTLVPNFHTYAVSPDGQRFVVPLPVSTLRSTSAAITVVLNFRALLAD